MNDKIHFGYVALMRKPLKLGFFFILQFCINLTCLFDAQSRNTPKWISWRSGDPVPADAVVGGRDCDGSIIYVGRQTHLGDLLPAKVIPMRNVAYVSYGGKEISYINCEILLLQRSKWVRSIQGSIPTGAIPVGHTETGEKLYAARLNHKNSITVGKLHPSHRMCYIPFDGKEVSSAVCEVLINSN